MRILLEKLRLIVHKLEEENGPILVFALFLREHPLEKWDVVVSATWLKSNDISSLKLIFSKFQESLSENELIQISRIVILEPNDDAVTYLQNEFSITNGHFEEVSAGVFSERFGFTIKRAYLLRCQKLEDPLNN